MNNQICIIAEKPSVAREIARIVGATERAEGYLKGNGYYVTWAFGHLVMPALPAASPADMLLGNIGGCRNCRFRLSGICVVVCSWRRERKPQSGDARKS